MASSVSIPEKSLEHWSSQHIMFRYHSKASLWWPAMGEDINVRWFPGSPGKAIQLELKTTTIVGAGLHDVMVDLGQLWEYYRRPLGRQPFYVFPWPHWIGDLAVAANSAGRRVADLAFESRGRDWWFANWMAVLTTEQVARVLFCELRKHGSGARGKKKSLVRFDLSQSLPDPIVTWASAIRPDVVSWREFWPTLEKCGKPEWPQLIVLPNWVLTSGQSRYHRLQIAELLRYAANSLAEVVEPGLFDESQMVIFEPDTDDVYRVSDSSDFPQWSTEVDGEHEDHRQVVFLDANAIR